MILLTGGACVVLFGGHAWFYLGGHAWFYLGGHAWFYLGGHAWFYLGGMRGFIGGMRGFIWGGMHGFIQGGHAWFYLGGHAWFYLEGCMVLSGGGRVWFFQFFGYNEIWSMSGRYASYWNAFLFEGVKSTSRCAKCTAGCRKECHHPLRTHFTSTFKTQKVKGQTNQTERIEDLHLIDPIFLVE